MKHSRIATFAIALALLGATAPVRAQDNSPLSSVRVTIKTNDSPVRRTLEGIFQQAGIANYIIESGVAGFVTVNLTDQPFESALKLVMRANTVPLTYTRESGVWIVKPRLAPAAPLTEAPTAPEPESPSNAPRYERIALTHVDPADLQTVLGGILTIQNFTRQRNSQGFSPGQGLNNNGRSGFGQGNQLGPGQNGLGLGRTGNSPGQNGAGSGILR